MAAPLPRARPWQGDPGGARPPARRHLDRGRELRSDRGDARPRAGRQHLAQLRHPRGQEPRGAQRARPSRPAGQPADPRRVWAVRTRRASRRRHRGDRDRGAARATGASHRRGGRLRFHQPHCRAGGPRAVAPTAARGTPPAWTGQKARRARTRALPPPFRGRVGEGARCPTFSPSGGGKGERADATRGDKPFRRSRAPRDDRPEKPPGRPRRGHAWRKDDAPLRRTYRGSRRDDLKIADEARPDKRAGLLKDRKGRRILVERFGTRKPKPEQRPDQKPKHAKRPAPARHRTPRPPPRDRAGGPRPSRPRTRPDRDR